MGKKSREKQNKKGQSIIAGLKNKKNKNSLENILLWVARLAVYGSLFTPLILSDLFYFPFVGPKSIYFIGLAEIIIFSWLGLAIISKQYRPKKNLLAFALLAFFLILILSAVSGVNFSNSFWSKFERMTGILMWIHLIGFFLATTSIFKKESDWQKFFITSLACAFIICILSLTGISGSTRGGSTVGNSSFLGAYLLFNIFFATYLFFRKNFYWKISSAVLGILMFAIIYKEGARAATLAVLGGFFLLGLFYLAFAAKKRYLKIIGIVLLCFSLVAFIATTLLVFKQGSFVRDEFIKQASKSRVVVWEKAWKGFQERPLLGWGPENFEFVFEKYFNPCMFLPECGGEIWFDRAHNIVFDTLSAEGILGFIFYLGIFISAFYVLWKSFREKRLGFWACAVPTVLLIAYFVQNLTVFDMVSSYLMFFLVLSFISSATSVSKQQEVIPGHSLVYNNHNWSLGVLFVAFCFAQYIFVIQPLKADYYPISALKAQDSAERLNFYEKTLKASPVGKYQLREFFAQNTQRIIQLNMADLYKDQAKMEAARKEWNFVVKGMEQSREEAPIDFRAVLRLSQLYNLGYTFSRDNLALADEMGQKAIQLAPTNQQGYWVLSQTRVYQGNLKDAQDLADKAIELEPRELEAYKVAVQIAKMANNQEKADALIAKATAIRSEWEAVLKDIWSGASAGGDV